MSDVKALCIRSIEFGLIRSENGQRLANKNGITHNLHGFEVLVTFTLRLIMASLLRVIKNINRT